jgi:hypothetical protein
MRRRRLLYFGNSTLHWEGEMGPFSLFVLLGAGMVVTTAMTYMEVRRMRKAMESKN